ncbi:2-hydroxyacid dehydrogenase [Niveomyces insectorum RCEF 264]|uniref:2-hydroxyacid dehydrogenase n=1 Tax=Niveomyces insectorum RCEF 264 TaxID=1081102 RepID=A0A167NFG2_9HYPO|nr:2-hydroxyacid dehydrogenase [Niveomyces insectorum RCEF 264]
MATIGISKKKRNAADGSPSPALKRRKASNMSVASISTAHPLRQTSFPPEDAATPLTARSPSFDIDNASFVSGGQSAATVPIKKRRGRKPKADKIREQTPSILGSKALAAAGGVSGPKSNAGVPGDVAAEDDDGDGDVPDSGAATAKRTDEERKEEKRLRAALVACMDFDQYERISAWRAAKLPDAVIRRLVNATVSQSVPSSVVTAVRSVTKYFLTDLITNAQKIQDEWIAADSEEQADKEWPGKVFSRGEPEVKELYNMQSTLAIPEWEPETAEHILKVPPKGPLRPDHLREAWRRYRYSVQGKTAGSMDLWHSQQKTGVERFPARTGGKKIFR